MNSKEDETKAKKKAFELRDYIGEKLNALENRRSGADHPYAGLHYRIGLEVPREIIMEALGKTNDAVMNRTGKRGKDEPQRRGFNPSKYFAVVVKNICHDRGIAFEFKGGGRKKPRKYTGYKVYLASTEWKEKRAARLRLDKFVCTKCGENLTITSGHVHHTTYDNWPNEKLTDLVSLCWKCHSSKHNIRVGTDKRDADRGLETHNAYEAKWVSEQMAEGHKRIEELRRQLATVSDD